ncbi:MAG: signal peptidase I [Clostridiales bacterium]|nr:signal peptidase I [Clostridiales bacterium]
MKIKELFKSWGIPIIIAAIIALLLNKFVFFIAEIPSKSMVPTLNVDDRLIVTRVYNTDKINRGDIIVFHSREYNDIFIKRVIGLPGDKVQVIKGIVYVNGEELVEDYIPEDNNELTYSRDFEVPEGKFLFFGDNRKNSDDARKWKKTTYIDGEDIMGKAQIKIYPFSDFKFLN